MKLSLLVTGFLGLSLSAQAFTNVCLLKDKEIDSSQFSAAQVQNYKDRIKTECEIADRYQKIKERLEHKYSIKPEQITIYQTMRYVERYRFNDAASTNTPVPLIYQKLRTDYKKSNDEKSTEIWNNFTIGIRQLEGVKLKVAAGEKFTLSDLQAVHKGFFTVSDEKGDFTHEPHPGEIKPESDQDNEWWKLKSEDVASAVAVVDRKNSEYQQMGLMTNFKGDAYINNLLSVKPLGAVFAIYSGDTRANKQHTENILNFMNTLLEQAHQGQHMVWRGQLFSPARLAFFMQQYYVAIHPFHEGNGRTSRFLQELILTSFSLPHGSSGDLMASDVLTGHEDYYRLAVNKTSELVQALQNCMDGPYKFVTGPIGASKDLASKDQSTIEYGCRIIGN